MSACVPTQATLTRADIIAALRDCGGPDAGAGCFFRNSPVRLQDRPQTLAGRPYTFFPTAEPLAFVDGSGREWHAPRETLTDGASIPRLFVSIVGDPRSPEFVNAAAIHDAYCGVGNELGNSYHQLPWQDVHRMFYDTLVVGGTPVIKAQLMFSAVWLGGPRWSVVTGKLDTQIDRIAESIKQDAMRETKAFIEREKPTIALLIRYLLWQEQKMLWRRDDVDDPRAESELDIPFDPNDLTNPISPPGG